MKHAAILLIALLVAGCATQHSALNQSPDSPAVIYVIPQWEAFLIAREAIWAAAPTYVDSIQVDEVGVQLRGYRAINRSWFRFHSYRQQLYVIPAAGTASDGREIDGFRFVIGNRGPLVINGSPFFGRLQDSCLSNTLIEALDATRTATTVTNLQLRPYDKDRDYFGPGLDSVRAPPGTRHRLRAPQPAVFCSDDWLTQAGAEQ